MSGCQPIQIIHKDSIQLIVKREPIDVTLKQNIAQVIELGPQNTAPISFIEQVIEVVEFAQGGAQGPVGPVGPSAVYDIVPITTIPNVWMNVPFNNPFLTRAVGVDVYDQLNQEMVELDVRILIGGMVQIRSNKANTYNVHIAGD